MSLVAEHISKSFAGKLVLSDVGLSVAPGEVRALLGANGSGKSTLVKILTGVYQADKGQISIGGHTLHTIASPNLANQLGIAVVHQEAPLIDTSTVAECIALFRGFPVSGLRVQWRRLYSEVNAMFERFGLDIDPRRLAGTLTPSERALIALIIALDRVSSGLNLLILDEVTASLPRDEAEPYLEKVMEIAGQGVGILMVTHRLAELHGRATTMTILRDGRKVYDGPADAMGEDEVILRMVGEEEQHGADASSPSSAVPVNPGPPQKRTEGGVLLRVENLKVDRLVDISFDLHRHEIVGVAGLEDTGIRELPDVLSGAQVPAGGRVLLDGRPVNLKGGPQSMINSGIAVLPADRLRSGGIATLSVAENIALPDVGRFFMHPARERAMVKKVIEDFDVRPPRPSALFGWLSGGNQQKALLGKWLHLDPAVLVLDDPTSGVDPGARQTIFAILRRAVDKGLGVLLLSTEPEQLASLCSRVLVIRDGQIATQLANGDLNHQTISKWCYA